MLKDSLYKALTSHINYVNYLEGLTFTVDKDTDFELLQAIYIGFLYTILFDDYFSVRNKRVTSLLTDSFTEELISKVSIKTSTEYVFGKEDINLGYDSKELALYKLRNKMAHGDFYLEDGNIVFEEGGGKALIKLDDFTAMVSDLEYYGDKNKKYEENTKILHINRCDSSKKLDFNKLHQLTIKDKPISPHIRDDVYVKNMEGVIGEINKLLKANEDSSIKSIKYIINANIPKWRKEYGIDIECSIASITTLPKYREIRERLLNKIEEIESKHENLKVGVNGQIYLLSGIVYDFENENKIAIRKSILCNAIMLQFLNKYHNAPIEELIKYLDPKISKVMLTGADNVIMISYLVAFYSIFQYGLETSMTKCNERRMYDVYDKTNLDFSELDVDVLNTNTRVKGIEEPKQDYSKEKGSKLLSAEAKYHGLLDGYNNLINQMGSLPESANSLVKKLEVAREEYKKLRQETFSDLCVYADFLSKHDSDKYVNNLDIIYHVRNAIAHGNIRIEKYGKDLNSTVIHIIDRKEGRTGDIVYDKKITIGEFNKIFSGTNIDVLHKFLAEHADNKEIVDEKYLEKVYERIEER